MNNRNDVEVLIDGRRYTICGFESDEYLQKVASYINQKFGEFKKIDNYRSMDLELRNVLLGSILPMIILKRRIRRPYTTVNGN